MAGANANWVGELLDGRYQVLKQLAKGGMSVVYLAFDRRLKRYVVVKTPRSSFLASEEFHKRFYREIRALMKLTHPNLVVIYDLGEHHGRPYAVLRYLDGGTLRERLTPNQFRLPLLTTPDSVLLWLPAIADVLDYLHRHNYLHRDIKPENILFDRDDHPFLSDFGTVKVLYDLQPAAEPESRLTELGQAIGTLPYMAPEVLSGGQLTEKVDQYALAVTVYEVLSGHLPYPASNPAELSLSQKSGPPERLDRRAGVPPAIADVVEKALALEPRNRFASCTEFATAYAQALRNPLGFGVPPLPPPSGKSLSPAQPSPTRTTDRQSAASAEQSPALLPGSAGLELEHTPDQAQAESGTLVLPATPQHVSIINPQPAGHAGVPHNPKPIPPPIPPPPPPRRRATASAGAASQQEMVCPSCGSRFPVSVSLLRGAQVTCPMCGTPILVGAVAIPPQPVRRPRTGYRRGWFWSAVGLIGVAVLLLVLWLVARPGR